MLLVWTCCWAIVIFAVVDARADVVVRQEHDSADAAHVVGEIAFLDEFMRHMRGET